MGIGRYLSLVKFSHSVFALPFALQGAWLAQRGVPGATTLLWIVVCAVAARTAAMGYNRLVDRELDAANPRTSQRELPAGLVAASGVRSMVLLSSAVFIGGAFQLSALAGWLSLPVLLVLLGYSWMKRISFLAHGVLGIALALAPLGAWVAVRGNLEGDLLPVCALALAVLTWVAGFDLIYACQDADFDRERGLHSIPARFGVRGALRISSILHVVTVLALAFMAWRSELSWIFALAILGAALLLVWEHRLVRPDDLSRVDMAFFTLNGWVGIALFVGMALDLGLLSADTASKIGGV
ncbi:MAG: 4-hydroxybenzoate polyprenyltransferase [Planctomycetota bacterium]|jgi:4-hydroxybenzoate polyprenyltransferase